MPKKREIIDYLYEIGDVERRIKLRENEDVEIHRVSMGENAINGELAWISESKIRIQPKAPKKFKGSLLIAPAEFRKTCPESKRIAWCKDPKLAFIKTVNKFFPELTITQWPRIGEPPVHSTASVGQQVHLSHGVVIGSGVIIDDGVFVGPNTVIANAIVKCGCKIGANCSIGLPGFGFAVDNEGRYWRFPHIGRVVIEEAVEIGSNTCIDRGGLGDTIVGGGSKIDNLVHIAHNVTLGKNAIVIANSMIGGSAAFAGNVWVAPSVSVRNKIKVGEQAVLGMGAVVLKDVGEMSIMGGNPARLLRKRGGHEKQF